MKPYSIAHHTRLKPKKESTFGKKKSVMRTTQNVSIDDLKFLDWLQHQPYRCIICDSSRIEWHHVKRNSSDKKNHKRLIPLCYEHHVTSVEMSPHGAPKKFRASYSMEYQNALADEIYETYLEEKEA